MRMLFQRILLPLLLLAAGVASLVYGFGYHTRAVITEQQVEEKITIPAPELAMPVPGELPGMAPPFPPPPMVRYEKRTVRSSKAEPESQLVFEVSIGGIALLESGELKRTYAGKAPSLCPS